MGDNELESLIAALNEGKTERREILHELTSIKTQVAVLTQQIVSIVESVVMGREDIRENERRIEENRKRIDENKQCINNNKTAIVKIDVRTALIASILSFIGGALTIGLSLAMGLFK